MKFYDDINSALDMDPCFYITIVGNFNAKLGKTTESEEFVGRFVLGQRNMKGHTLAGYHAQRQLYAMNTLFHKKNQMLWTWRNPNGKTKNQIDFILSNKKYIFKNVDIINRVGAGSDHRILRGRLSFNLKLKRRRLVETNICCT